MRGFGKAGDAGHALRIVGHRAEPTKRAAGTRLFLMNVSTNEASRWDAVM
jgi:hypothetical protein